MKNEQPESQYRIAISLLIHIAIHLFAQVLE